MITIKDGELYQWDTGRVISVIPRSGETVNEIHVYNGTTEYALVLKIWEENNRTHAKIPDTFLQITNNITVYAVMTDVADRRTAEHAQYMVYSRKKPEDYIYEPEEILRYTTLEKEIKRLSEEIKSIEQNGTGGTSTSYDEATGDLTIVSAGLSYDENTGNLTI